MQNQHQINNQIVSQSHSLAIYIYHIALYIIMTIISGSLIGRTIRTIQIGDWASQIIRVDEIKINAFAQITGDFNPIHLDEQIAKQSRYKQRIAHGYLSACTIPAIFSFCLPNSIYRSQTLWF